MNLPLLVLLCLATHQSLACRELFHNKTRLGGYAFRYDYTNRRYMSYDTTINNCTIVCSNIYSISEIFYTYKERTYDQFLKITDSNITILHSNELDSFPTIAKLYLSGIHIERILPGAFTGLLRLRELYLDHNELSEVSKGVFTSLQKLEILDLSNNGILQIEKLALMGVSNLRRLFLQNNNISRVEDDIFDKLDRLDYLDMSGNPLGTLPMNSLSNLDYLILENTSLSELSGQNFTLKLLDLSSSQISAIDFSKFPHSDYLDLSNNRISSLKNCEDVRGVVINFTSNRIRLVEGSFKSWTSVTLEGNQLERINGSLLNQSTSILSLNLGRNQISIIDVDAFRNLTSLRVLFLNNNRLSKLDPILFRDLTSLTHLALSYNDIVEFQYGTFDGLKSLYVLDISHNRLSNLHPFNFYSLTHLVTLNFDSNEISSFDVQDLTSHLKSIVTISLDGNPWKCRQLIQMSHTLKNMSVVIKEGDSYDVENFNGIACQNDNAPSQDSTGMMKRFENLMNETLKNEDARMERFFSELENSTFVKFLNANKFAKLLDDFRNGSVAVAERAVQTEFIDGGNNGVLILSVLLQFVICALLMFIVYLMLKFMKRGRKKKGSDTVSQVELCSDY